MLIGLTEILKIAEEKNFAVGAFNTPTLECIRAVIDNAEKFNVPVIISHAELHENEAPLSMIGPVMVFSAEKASVPVCVLLDHCEHLDYMEKALKIGFTGIMYDGSLLPYEKNTANTVKAVEISHRYGAGVEGEIGQLASREDGAQTGSGPVYTDPELALKFVKETGVDALAPSFGTAHGIYKSKPVLDLQRVAVIRDIVKLPLVMHGGSGVSPEDYRTAIKNGVRKINYYSYMSKAGTMAAKDIINNENVTFYHEVAHAAKKAMEKDAEKAMKVFYNL